MSTSIKRSPIAGLPQPRVRTADEPDTVPRAPIQMDVMRSLRRRPRLAAGVAGVVFVLVVLLGLSRTPVYQAESITYIEPLASKVLSDGASSGTYDSSRYDSYLQQQMQTAVRPDILAAAIEKLPPNVWQHPGEKMQSAVSRLQGALTVDRVTTSYQLAITLSDPNPETAASVVNAVTNTYLEQGRKDEHAVIDQRLQLLGEERQRIQQMLDEDRLEQASLGKALGVANASGTVGSAYDAQIAGVQTQIAGAREAKAIAAAQLASLPSQGDALSPALAAAAEDLIGTDVGLNSMKATITSRKAVLSTQMAGLTPNNPIYKQDQAEIADLDRSLDAMTTELRAKTARRLQDKMRADLQRTADVEGRLDAQLQRQTATATGVAPKVQRLAELTADMQRLDARYGVVDDAMRGLQLESSGPGSAHLSVAAAVPVSPEPSKRKLILLLAFPLGLCFGLGAALLANRLDPRIYSGSDVARVLGFLPIGVMPARAEVSSRVMEEYTLRLAAGLQSAYRTSGAQSFVFTSTGPAVQIGSFVRAIEGVLSSLGFKAIVMDASSVLHAAGRNQAAKRDSSLLRSSALMRTIEGVRQGYAAEEIDRLKLKYDLLLIDAPPLLHSAETEYLARCTDATILIAESGVTVKPELFQSALLLQHLNVAGVGAVLQELHLKDADSRFRSAITAVEGSASVMRDEAGQIPFRPMDAVHAAAEPAQIRQGEPSEESPAAVEAIRESTPVRHNLEEAALVEHVVSERPAPRVDRRADEAEAASSSPEVPETVAPVSPANVGKESVYVEERDQVRLWNELMKRRQTEPAKADVPRAVEEAMEPDHGHADEPVLYFEDRLRPRRPQEPVAPYRAAEAVTFDPVVVAEPVPQKILSETQVWNVVPEPAGDTAGDFRYGHEAVSSVEPVFDYPADEPYSELAAFEPIAATMQPPTSEREWASVDSGEETLRTPFYEEHMPTTLGYDSEPIAEVVVGTDAEESGPRGEKIWSNTRALEAMEAFSAPPEEMGLPESGAMPQQEGSGPNEPVMQDEGKEQEVAAVSNDAVPPKREASPARMEWFTLRFRGTSERVLRLVPGEEGENTPDQEEAPEAAASEARGVAVAGADEAFAQASLAPEQPMRGDGVTNVEEGGEAREAEAFAVMIDNGASPDAFNRGAALDAEEADAAGSQPRADYDASDAAAEVGAGQTTGENRAARLESLHRHSSGGEARPAESSTFELEPSVPVALEALQPVDTVPIARAKINRWAVHDDEPGAPEESVIERYPAYPGDGALDMGHAAEAAQPRPDVPATSAVDRLAPALLVEELRRHNSLGSAPVAAPGAARSWSRRSVSAPVEERLEPKAPSMTRRWQMLSRFDQPATEMENSVDTLQSGVAAMDRVDG